MKQPREAALAAPRTSQSWADWAAVSASGLCLVHCLALPLVIAVLPSFGGAIAGSGTHWALLAFALPVSLWVLTRDPWPAGLIPLALGSAGLSLMTVGVAVYEGLPAERGLTVAGVSLVAAAHLVRWWRRRATSRTI
jgi:hypothetical protein